MPLNVESEMDGPEVVRVRDLHGEDLDHLTPGSPASRTRFLVEAGELLAAREDGDLLVVGAHGEVWAAAAAGYDRRFDDVRIVTARQPRDQESLRRVLVAIEERALRRRCPTLVAAVDVLDEAARRTFERLGYAVTGAGIAVWSDLTTTGPPECSVDTWTVRKHVASPAGGRAAPGRPSHTGPDDGCEERHRLAE
jgi:hypothetical protein